MIDNDEGIERLAAQKFRELRDKTMSRPFASDDCIHDYVMRHELRNHDGSPFQWWQCETCEEHFITISTHVKVTGDALNVIEQMTPFSYHMTGVDWGLVNDVLAELQRLQPPRQIDQPAQTS